MTVTEFEQNLDMIMCLSVVRNLWRGAIAFSAFSGHCVRPRNSARHNVSRQKFHSGKGVTGGLPFWNPSRSGRRYSLLISPNRNCCQLCITMCLSLSVNTWVYVCMYTYASPLAFLLLEVLVYCFTPGNAFTIVLLIVLITWGT